MEIDAPAPTELDNEQLTPPCEIWVAKASWRKGRIKSLKRLPTRCEYPAEFYGRFPCCSEVVLACKLHASNGNDTLCAHCMRTFSPRQMNWTML